MSGRSMVSRVVRGTVVVALVSSLVLAGTAATVARFLWRSREERALAESASALVRAMEVEAAEDRTTLEAAAPGAIAESALVGYHIEVWRGARLVAMHPAGPALGPVGSPNMPSSGMGSSGMASLGMPSPGMPSPGMRGSGTPSPGSPALQRSGWLVRTEDLPGGLSLIVALPGEYGHRALRVFTLSILLSLPFCLLLAVVVGGYVGRRATRPLVDFTARVSRIRELRGLDPPGSGDLPGEVRDLEESFRSLLGRLMENLSREMEFAANASHELRTPLTTIRLHAERAREDAGSMGKRELDEQLREIDRLVRLVDSLLVLARDIEAGIPRGEVVNLADLAREVAGRAFAGASRPELALPDEALVRGDEDLLSIAVENLLDNARKFASGSEGCSIRLADAAGRVTLSVTSAGVRIADQDRDRLFERFYRSPEARASREGHGLGLSLARHIARLHGGDLRCVSGAGEDARFTLELPAWQPGAS